MLTGPRGLFLIAGQEKVVTVDLERVLTAPPVEHLTVHRRHRRPEGDYPYACLDGTYMKRNWGGAYESVAVLVAIGNACYR